GIGQLQVCFTTGRATKLDGTAGNEGLALSLGQAQPSKNPTRLRKLVVDEVIGIVADRTAGRCRRDLVNAVEPANLLDQVHLAFEIDAEGWHSERVERPMLGPDQGQV